MNFWDILREEHPEVWGKIQEARGQILEAPVLERKYRELILAGMNCVLRNRDGVVLHGREAVKNGASREQVLAAIEESFLAGGIPAMKTGLEAFAVIFPE